MITGVLFDFSGTLVDCGDAWWKLELETTVRQPLTLLAERGAIAIGEAELVYADRLYGEMRRQARETGVEVSVQEATQRVAAALGLIVSAEAVAAAVDDLFRACLSDVRPLDGAGETLHTLRQRGLVLAVISNARHGPFVSWALERLDMLRFFSTVVVSADVGLRKPRPEIFWMTLRTLGLSSDRGAFVGDYYPYDMVGARAAGLRSIWLVDGSRPYEDLPADAVIHNLRDLPGVIARLDHQ